MSRLVVVLTKPKQQLRASHSSSIIPLPVAVSLLLPRRISSAEDIYPTSDFSPRVTVLFYFVLFSLKPGCFWISGAQRVLFLYFWLLPDSLITIGTKTCRGDAAELLVPLYLLYIFLYFLYLAKLKMSEVERHVVFRPKLCALKLRAWCKAPLSGKWVLLTQARFLVVHCLLAWQRGEFCCWDRRADKTCRLLWNVQIVWCLECSDPMGVKLDFSLLLFMYVFRAMHVWSGVLQSVDFPIRISLFLCLYKG